MKRRNFVPAIAAAVASCFGFRPDQLFGKEEREQARFDYFRFRPDILIQKSDVKPGDLIIAKVSRSTSDLSKRQLREAVLSEFPNNPTLIIDDSVKMLILPPGTGLTFESPIEIF